MKEIGIYIHIPFCKRKCLYCDFISFENKENLIPKYIEALIREIKCVGINLKENDNSNIVVKTIYIGGGTPSFIDSKFIVKIMNTVKNNFNCNLKECTIEINPGTANKEKLLDYKKAGINRLSIGLQSVDNTSLKLIGRIHNYQDFLNTYNIARELEFNNINIDIISGLPNQTSEKIKNDLKEIIKLNPEHISVYSLIVEEGTKLCKIIDNNVIKLPDEKIERDIYWTVKNMLKESNYMHYEISNFAKKGFESQHNIDCWNQKEYMGFGVAAHSYTDNVRFSNIKDIEMYIKNCEQDKLEDNFVFHEKQDIESKLKEYMILKLRLIKGISIKEAKDIFKIDILKFFQYELEKLQRKELICIANDYIKLTNKGLDFANIVWEEFV